MTFPKVGIILINWNGEKDTVECLSSLEKTNYKNLDVLVVDNASSDGSAERIKLKFPNVTLIKNNSNLGFAEGNNVGIRFFLEKSFDYVLLLNNDVVVDANFLTELVKVSESKNDFGLYGPKIYFYDVPDEIWFAGGFINKFSGKPYHRGLYEKDKGQYDKADEVEYITGCALLVKREVFNKIGMLDPDFFYSHEDVDFCLRARRSGFKCLFVPSSAIRHKFAKAAGGRFSPLYIYYRVRNSLNLLKKNNFPFYTRALAFFINPVKMIAYTLFTFNFKGTLAAIIGVFDFMRSKYGKGPF